MTGFQRWGAFAEWLEERPMHRAKRVRVLPLREEIPDGRVYSP